MDFTFLILFSAKVHDKALKLHAVASLKAIATLNQDNHNESDKNGAIPAISNGQVMDGAQNNPGGEADPEITTRQVVVNNPANKDAGQGNGDARSQVRSILYI